MIRACPVVPLLPVLDTFEVAPSLHEFRFELFAAVLDLKIAVSFQSTKKWLQLEV